MVTAREAVTVVGLSRYAYPKAGRIVLRMLTHATHQDAPFGFALGGKL